MTRLPPSRALRTQICFPRRCGGCSGAITRILTKVDGIDKVEPDLETQKVTIEVAEGSSVDGEAILQKLNGPRPASHLFLLGAAAPHNHVSSMAWRWRIRVCARDTTRLASPLPRRSLGHERGQEDIDRRVIIRRRRPVPKSM